MKASISAIAILFYTNVFAAVHSTAPYYGGDKKVVAAIASKEERRFLDWVWFNTTATTCFFFYFPQEKELEVRCDGGVATVHCPALPPGPVRLFILWEKGELKVQSP
jgi:hypothetical protein